MKDQSISPFDLALGAEIRAARVEAALQMDPVIAAQWRAEVGVAEAVASIGLEDVRISEPDLLIRISENTGSGIEARAVEDALAVLRFIRAPGDVRGEADRVVERIDRLAMREADPPDALPAEELVDIFDHCRGRAPIIEAMRAAAEYAWRTERRSPVAERMVFMAAEHASRRLGHSSVSIAEDELRGLGGRYYANWICPPSLALSRLRFRIWSPSNPAMVRDLLEGIDRVLSHEQGRIITIRRWREKLEEISQGRHGRSRLADAGKAFGIEPFMTSRVLADRIGVTQRGALKLLSELSDLGLITELTRRRSARIWATPGLARMLMPAGVSPARAAARSRADQPAEDDHSAAAPAEALAARNLKEEGQASMERAIEEFDAVLDNVDEILGRIGGRAN